VEDDAGYSLHHLLPMARLQSTPFEGYSKLSESSAEDLPIQTSPPAHHCHYRRRVGLLICALAGLALFGADRCTPILTLQSPWTPLVRPDVAQSLTFGAPRNPAYLIEATHGAVASENGVCSQVGVDAMRDGGNAVDAAIASTLCIGVQNMFSWVAPYLTPVNYSVMLAAPVLAEGAL
jgi:gamma-glutamyltranspeptidase/glutathione hydrolase/leukotriene-C4 hydrolase